MRSFFVLLSLSLFFLFFLIIILFHCLPFMSSSRNLAPACWSYLQTTVFKTFLKRSYSIINRRLKKNDLKISLKISFWVKVAAFSGAKKGIWSLFKFLGFVCMARYIKITQNQ